MPNVEVNDPAEPFSNCPLCNADLGVTPTECPRCDWVKGYRHRKTGGNQRDLTASLLSLVPGFGHLYKGHRTGWLFLAGTIMALGIGGLAATPSMGLGLIILPFYWGWVMVQAYWVEDLNSPGEA